MEDVRRKREEGYEGRRKREDGRSVRCRSHGPTYSSNLYRRLKIYTFLLRSLRVPRSLYIWTDTVYRLNSHFCEANLSNIMTLLPPLER